MVESAEALQVGDALEAEELRADDCWSSPPLRASAEVSAAANAGEYVCEGRVVLWTDGACRNNADARFSRAGCGIFLCSRTCFEFLVHPTG